VNSVRQNGLISAFNHKAGQHGLILRFLDKADKCSGTEMVGTGLIDPLKKKVLEFAAHIAHAAHAAHTTHSTGWHRGTFLGHLAGSDHIVDTQDHGCGFRGA
jgi:hypothetical protein